MLRSLAVSLLVALPLLAQGFDPPCELPFADIAKRRPFDDQCGIDGEGTDPKKLLQNRVKNNFCAEGEPIFTTFKTYRELQRLVEHADVLGPKYGVPASREKLENIGYETYRPVRITGQLFFDASHKPCRGDKKPNPKRSSSWEIHPVYNVEVCRFATFSLCNADDDGDWITLEDYLNPAEESMEEDDEEGNDR